MPVIGFYSRGRGRHRKVHPIHARTGKSVDRVSSGGNVKHIPIEEEKPPVDKKTGERVVKQWIKVEKRENADKIKEQLDKYMRENGNFIVVLKNGTEILGYTYASKVSAKSAWFTIYGKDLNPLITVRAKDIKEVKPSFKRDNLQW